VGGGAINLTSGEVLLVRVAVIDDEVFEDPETLALVVISGDGVEFAQGVGTILDDGSGTIFYR